MCTKRKELAYTHFISWLICYMYWFWITYPFFHFFSLTQSALIESLVLEQPQETKPEFEKNATRNVYIANKRIKAAAKGAAAKAAAAKTAAPKTKDLWSSCSCGCQNYRQFWSSDISCIPYSLLYETACYAYLNIVYRSYKTVLQILQDERTISDKMVL